MIRDVASGRYVDRDKLHYVDFVGKYFSVKGPSITPRPPQGQPVVAALAHARPIYEFAARSADLVFITPKDDESAAQHSRRVARRRWRGSEGLRRLCRVVGSTLSTPARMRWSSTARATELVELMLRWQQLGIDGVRLRPAVNAVDLPFIVDEVVPLLRAAGGFRTAYCRRRDLATTPRSARRGEPLRKGGAAVTVPLSILDLAPISAGQRRANGPAQHRRPGPARRAVGIPPVLGRRAPLRRRREFVARCADRPDRCRHRPDSGRRRRGAARPDHRRRRRRELRHPRRIPSRPHRSRGRPVGPCASRRPPRSPRCRPRNRHANGARSTGS